MDFYCMVESNYVNVNLNRIPSQFGYAIVTKNAKEGFKIVGTDSHPDLAKMVAIAEGIAPFWIAPLKVPYNPKRGKND